ncbi:TPA: hypothetical protein EYP66_06355 [Candidatus Poribacteria bacterium]|nr:hypothetical protein [Candidatus Poribacteria bacterium]
MNTAFEEDKITNSPFHLFPIPWQITIIYVHFGNLRLSDNDLPKDGIPLRGTVGTGRLTVGCTLLLQNR